MKAPLTILKNTTIHKKNPPFHIYWFHEYFPAKLIPNDYEGLTCSFRTNLVPFRIRTFRHPLHVWWFCIFCTPSTFIPTSTFIREIRLSHWRMKNDGKQMIYFILIMFIPGFFYLIKSINAPSATQTGQMYFLTLFWYRLTVLGFLHSFILWCCLAATWETVSATSVHRITFVDKPFDLKKNAELFNWKTKMVLICTLFVDKPFNLAIGTPYYNPKPDLTP